MMDMDHEGNIRSGQGSPKAKPSPSQSIEDKKDSEKCRTVSESTVKEHVQAKVNHINTFIIKLAALEHKS